MKVSWWFLIVNIWDVTTGRDFNPILSVIPLETKTSEVNNTGKLQSPPVRSSNNRPRKSVVGPTVINSYQYYSDGTNTRSSPYQKYSNEVVSDQPILIQAQTYYRDNPEIIERVRKELANRPKYNFDDKKIEPKEEERTWSNMKFPKPEDKPSNQPIILASKQLELDIRRFVAYAGSSYCPDESIQLWNCLYCKILSQTILHIIFHDNVTNTHAILSIDETKRELILSYRGAEGFMKLLYVAGESLADFNYLTGSRVNANYLRSVQSIQFNVNLELSRLLIQSKYAQYNIVLVGHSLGGALALLSAPMIHFDLGFPQSRIKVYTYGMPRVGDKSFAQRYHQLGISVTRVVNNKDGISQHPSYGEYHHVPNEVWINQHQFQLCSANFDEDPRCSLGTPVLSGFFDYHFKVDDLLVTELGC